MKRLTLLLPGLILAICAVFIWSLSVGAVKIAPDVILNTLFDLEGEKQTFIINKSRLPRALLAVFTGAALALSGTIIQALLRNALASPKIIGINSGAALAVLLAAMYVPDLALSWLPLIAGAGGALAAAFVYILAEIRPISPARLALVGIAVGFTFDAVSDFILVTADTYAISAPLVWLTGSLWARGWQHLNAVWPILSLLSALCLIAAYRMDLIRLGATQATALGMNVRIERLILLSLATLLAAVSVSVVGVIGFIGLMSPHIARGLVGGRHGALLPVAALIGALLVLLADAVGRALAPPVEISAGIFTALFGAPFFIYILLKNRSGAEE